MKDWLTVRGCQVCVPYGTRTRFASTNAPDVSHYSMSPLSGKPIKQPWDGEVTHGKASMRKASMGKAPSGIDHHREDAYEEDANVEVANGKGTNGEAPMMKTPVWEAPIEKVLMTRHPL